MEGPISSGQDGGDDRSLPTRGERIRRRNRTITSCLECRRRKLGCNKTHPCTHCRLHGRNCVYISTALDPRSQVKLAEIKEEWGSIERKLERDIARAGHPQSDDPLPGRAKENIPAGEGEQDLEPSPLAVTDAAYEDDADGELYDLGIQLGRMRCWNHATHERGCSMLTSEVTGLTSVLVACIVQ
ncbi:hypothetical protein GP486_001482 [Trichoglossum hirsutum]|uniref:Zn(2)-C6 fungal-type domain-containing protein n=1 Tax=Trichoglossum hirsutum TaxID=265104 RepID=A0A9P8LGL2_9PEZI|nr:hypothetical protein GP486_001482 [Trichoglossum hirsutum]